MTDRTAGNETRWRLSSYDNFEIDVGQNYSFEVRSKARSCYGKKSVVFAVLPGISLFSIFPSIQTSSLRDN